MLEYDDVMNSQREVIYTKRHNALFGERISLDIANMMYDLCEGLINESQNNLEFNEFNLEVIRIFSTRCPFDEDTFKRGDATALTEQLYDHVLAHYQRKSHVIAEQAFPVIKDVYEKQSAQYENIVVPISDGPRTYQIVTNLKKGYESKGARLVKAYEKVCILLTIDEEWKEHLREMDELKQSVQNAAYEQKDPLLIYKFESFELFRKMLDRINRDISARLQKAHIPMRESAPAPIQKHRNHKSLI